MYLAKHNTISIIEKQFNREKIYKILLIQHLRYILITPTKNMQKVQKKNQNPKYSN